jgi:hypothetical protein
MGFKVSAVALGQVLRRIHTNSEKRLLASSCLSVRLSVRMEQLVFLWTIFHETWHLNIFRKSDEKIQVWYKSDSYSGYCTLSWQPTALFTVQYSTVQYSAVQYSAVQYSTVQYSAVQYSTVQYNTVSVQYSTVQYQCAFPSQHFKVVSKVNT